MKVAIPFGRNKASLPWSLARSRVVLPVLMGVALVVDSLVIVGPAGAQPDVETPVAGNDTSGLPTSGQPGSSQSIEYPTDLQVDAQGNVYFVDPFNAEVDVVSSSTGLLTVLAGDGNPGSPTSGQPGSTQEIGDAYSLAVDSAGNIYIADNGNNEIDEISAPTIDSQGVVTAGGIITVLADSTNGVNDPTDVAVDSSGEVYFANSGGGDSVYQVTREGATELIGSGTPGVPTAGSSGVGQSIGLPDHLATDAAGDVYIVDDTNDEIDVLSAPIINNSGDVTNGDIVTVLAGNGTSGEPVTGEPGVGQEIGLSTSIAMDSSGNIYFTDWNHGQVDELSTPIYNHAGILIGGDILNILAGTGGRNTPVSGQPGYTQPLGDPYSVAVDASGNVYFTDGYLPYPGAVDMLSPGSYTDGVLTGGDIVTILAQTGFPLPIADVDGVNDLAVTAGGEVYITDDASNNDSTYVERLDSSNPPIGFDDTVTYSPGAGTGTVPTQDPVVDLGTFTVASGGSLSNPGYSFAGWSDGTTTYQPGATYTVGSAPVTLTAVWKAVSLVPVTYANGGGTGTLPTQGAVQAGTTITVASGAGLSDPGYTFAGWSDGTTTYQPGDAYTVGGSPVTFTAQWKSSSSSSSGSSTSHLSDTVYFALGSSKLTPGDLASLKTFAVKVKNANVTALTVTGYADSTGTEPNNHSLSIQRARSVAAELTKLGLTSVTVHVLGGGVSHTFANAALDRRATITS